MGELSLVVGAALTCVLSGVVPWINAELVIIGAAFLVSPAAVPPLVLGCAVGQMASKAGVYGLSRVAPHRLPGRMRRLVARAEGMRGRRHTMAAVVLSSALVSLPPFYLVTIACGVMRVPFVPYVLLGLVGTTTRYAFLVWLSFTVHGS